MTPAPDAALSWKPGPPPLDVTARYYVAVKNQHGQLFAMAATFYDDGDIIGEEGIEPRRDRVLYHIGPLPPPPAA